MKKIMIMLGACLLMASCAKEINSLNTDYASSVNFTGTIEDTKVTTTEGKSVWNAGDAVSIFSATSDGTIVGGNTSYTNSADGAIAVFAPTGDAVAASDMYYAYYPYSATYPSLKNDDGIGFPGAAVGDQVTNYKYMPVTVNSGYTITIDPATGKTVSGAPKYFYASSPAPVQGSDVAFTFKPVLPILELGLRGSGNVTTVVIAYTDKSIDTYNGNSWLTAKGIFNVATGVLTTTNVSSSAYCKFTATLNSSDGNAYVTLNPDTPVRFQIPTGHFTITKGLTITVNFSDGTKVVKNIWQNQTVSGLDANGKCKHIYQPLLLPFVSASAIEDAFAKEGGSAKIIVKSSSAWSLTSKPEWVSLSAENGASGDEITVTAAANSSLERNGEVVLTGADGASCKIAVSQNGNAATSADYYTVAISSIDWSKSYIYNVTDPDGKMIAMIANEYLGATVNKKAVVAYPMKSSTTDFTKGLVTNDGGSVNTDTIVPDDVVYSAGAGAVSTIWIKADGSEILTSAPGTGTVSDGVLAALVLTSDVKTHGTVKLGNVIWTAENYKTTKLADGSAITEYVAGTSFWGTGGYGYMVCSGEYVYNGWTLGFSTASPAVFTDTVFAPSGWGIASRNEVKEMLTFVGNYSNLNDASNFGILDPSPMAKGKTPTTVAYFAVRTCTPGTGTNSYMVGMKSDSSKVDSAQSLANGLPVRLIKK